MKTFENVQLGHEIEFLNSDNKLQTALVNYVDDRKFSVEVLKYNKLKKEFYSMELSFYLSGKKTNRYYNYGSATRIVNKWKN